MTFLSQTSVSLSGICLHSLNCNGIDDEGAVAIAEALEENADSGVERLS
jgi:hypothetical protein